MSDCKGFLNINTDPADREERSREQSRQNDCRVIIWSHALKQSARLSGELEREATRQDKTREREVIKT